MVAAALTAYASRFHFHHSSDFGLMLKLAANSLVPRHSPPCLSRFAHLSRDVCPIATSTMEAYVRHSRASETRFVERIR
jgi:hypothetical protein